MTGCALFVSQFFRHQKAIVQILSFGVLFIATYTLIGYAYGIQPVYDVAVLTPMALQVSVLFIISAICILSLVTDRLVIYITPTLIGIYTSAIIIFLSLSIYSFRTFKHLGIENVDVQQSYLEQTQILGLRNALVDAETGQRGYLITSNKSYLEPYTHALTAVNNDLLKIQRLPPSIINPPDLAELNRLVNLKLARLKTTINVQDSQGIKAATVLVEQGAGNTYMDNIRTILALSEKNIQQQI